MTTIDVLGDVATWVGSVGTIGTLAAALRLHRRQTDMHAKMTDTLARLHGQRDPDVRGRAP